MIELISLITGILGILIGILGIIIGWYNVGQANKTNFDLTQALAKIKNAQVLCRGWCVPYNQQDSEPLWFVMHMDHVEIQLADADYEVIDSISQKAFQDNYVRLNKL